MSVSEVALSETQSLACVVIQGKVELPVLQPVPQTLRALLEGDTEQAKEFRKNIRAFNNAFAFTSLGVKLDDSLLRGGGGPYVFKIHGELYHQHGSLIPYREGAPRSFAQLYIHDTAHAREDALQQRLNRNSEQRLNGQIFSDLQDMMEECNPFIAMYRQANERLNSQIEIPDIRVRLSYKGFQDPRRYNLPTGNELAVILPGESDSSNSDPRDIIVQRRGGQFHHIHQAQPIYAPLHYVMLFPRGERGWSWDIPYRGGVFVPPENRPQRQRGQGRADQQGKVVTQCQYYCLSPIP